MFFVFCRDICDRFCPSYCRPMRCSVKRDGHVGRRRRCSLHVRYTVGAACQSLSYQRCPGRAYTSTRSKGRTSCSSALFPTLQVADVALHPGQARPPCLGCQSSQRRGTGLATLPCPRRRIIDLDFSNNNKASPNRLVSEIYSRKRLRSASSTDVVVPATRRSSLGDRAFPVAGARAWNALPASVTSAPSLSSFRRFLKTFFFQ